MTSYCEADDCLCCDDSTNERKPMSPNADIPSDVTERRQVKIDLAVLRWLLSNGKEGFPIVLILNEDTSPEKFCGRYSVLDMRWEVGRPTVTVTVHREDVFLFSIDPRVLEIREGIHRCNKCSSDMRRYLDSTKTVSEVYGLAASYTAGYASDLSFLDGFRYFFNLCETCLHELFQTFEIPPTKEELF